jgi:hypothetical protein
MKVIIAGGRDFSDYNYLKASIVPIFPNLEIEVVSGCAKGADTLGEKFAEEMNLKLHKFPANWSKFGKSAGFKRNEEMAKNADCLIAFWDGKSKGTEHMIKCATKLGLKVHIVKY